MEEMTFEKFKDDCIRACHLRHSCEEGLRGVVNAENTLQLLAVVKTFWNDVYESKYADITAEKLQEWYGLKNDFNTQGIYVNEVAERGIVMVNNYGENEDENNPFVCGGEADIYIFGKSNVIALENARVHCHTKGSHVSLFNCAQGIITAGSVEVHGYATADISIDEYAECNGASMVRITKGTLIDKGHKRIYAYGDSVVVSDNPTGIFIEGNAKIISNEEFLKENDSDKKDE